MAGSPNRRAAALVIAPRSVPARTISGSQLAIQFQSSQHLGPPVAAVDVDHRGEACRPGLGHVSAGQQQREVIADQAHPTHARPGVGSWQCSQSSLASMNWKVSPGMPVVAVNPGNSAHAWIAGSRPSARRSGQRMIGVSG